MATKVKPGMLRGNTVRNELTDDPNDFTLKLSGGMSRSLADIVGLVVQSGITVKSAQDIEESFRMVMEKAIEQALSGNNVSLEYIQIRASVSGVFHSATESFTRPRHEVNPVLAPGEAFLEAARQTRVENMGEARPNVIASVVNRATMAVDTDVTSGGVLEVNGKGLKVGHGAGTGEKGCVYLLDAEQDSIVANIPLEALLVNTPTKLMFQVPAGVLEAGKRYTVKVATYLGSNRSEPLRTQRLIPCGKSLECK